MVLFAVVSRSVTAADAVYVATYLDLRAHEVEADRTMVLKYARDAHRAHGNLSAIPLEQIGRPSRFMVIESWQDQVDLAAFERSAPAAVLRLAMQQLLRSPENQRVHSGLSIDMRSTLSAPTALYVVTHVDVLPMHPTAEELLRQASSAGRAAPGNLRYDTYQQVPPHSNHFTVFAIWANQRDFDASEDGIQWRTFAAALAPMLGAPYDDRLYKRVTADQP